MTAETEVKNENITVKVKREAGCNVNLEVRLSPKATVSAYTRALKDINKEVSLPGFRKGRAPEAMILKQYSSHVEREWRDKVVRMGFEEGCALSKSYPFDQEGIRKPKLEECCKEEGALIIFSFEAEPDIPEVKPSALKIEKIEPKEVKDEDVENTLRDICVVHADWDDVEGRAVQNGDFVDLDIESLDEPGHMLCTDKRFELVPGKIGSWMLKLLVGMNPGETVEGVSELEKDQADAIKKFTPTKCKITLHRIRSIKLPELTDELAKKVGVDSVEALNVAIRRDLENSSTRDAEQAMAEQLDEQLLATYQFDIPASLFESERQMRLKHRLEMLKESKLTDEMIQAREADLEAEIAVEADRMLRLFFLVRQVAQEQNLAVGQEELVQELSRQLWSLPPEQRIVHQGMDPKEMQSQISAKIIRDKARAFLLAQVLAA